MKTKERYKLLNYAKEDYSNIFGHKYEFKKLSKKALYKLLRENKHSCMCEWSYCCYGLYQNCWQEPIEEGIWGMTQKDVDKDIKSVIDDTAKICKRDSRILYYENKFGIHVIIIARDVMSEDYLITFRNNVRGDICED